MSSGMSMDVAEIVIYGLLAVGPALAVCGLLAAVNPINCPAIQTTRDDPTAQSAV